MGIKEVRAEVQNGVNALNAGRYVAAVEETVAKTGYAATILGNVLLMLENTASLDTDRANGAASRIRDALAGAENVQAERAGYFAGQSAEKIEDLTVQAAEVLPAIRALVMALGDIQRTGNEAVIAIRETNESAQQYVADTYGNPRLNG